MATSKPVLFMDAKTPVNFRGKRQRQEVRALALRAASFSRPNRKKKNPKGREDSASSSRRQRCPLQGTLPTDATQPSDQRVRHCCFCGRPLEPSPKDLCLVSGNVQPAAPWHQICRGHSPADASTSVVARLHIRGPRPDTACDPFDSTPLAITADDHDVLNYIKSFTFAVNWPDELEACREGHSLYNAHLLMYRRYFTHPAPMSGLLSYAYNLMALAQPERAAYHRQISMKYSLQCFKFLRDLIDTLDNSDEQLMVIVQTIFPLAIAEYSESIRMGGDRSLQHRGALLRLIQLLGGPQRLPLVYRELFVNFFAKSAIVRDTATEIDPAAWDPGPWQGQLSDTVPSLSSELSPPSKPMADTSDSLSEILAGLRELAAVANIKRRGRWSDDDHLSPVFRWTYLRSMALKMRLWNFLHPPGWRSLSDSLGSDTKPHHQIFHYQSVEDYTRVSREFCLCLAAQLFIYLSLETCPVRHPTYSAPTQYADMLERSEILDTLLFGYAEGCGTIRSLGVCGLDATTMGEEQGQAQARDLLWIVAIGACFEEDASRQMPHNLIPGLAPTAKAAGFWDEKEWKVPLCVDDGDDSGSGSTHQTARWCFSLHFGGLARRLGYLQFTHVKELFSRSYVYDEMIMEETLNRLFAVGLST
ncbi:hypothetical protein G647_01125 [Cladophialophora carrionii CBS 160.54]|uniref:Transcription factor domain-containing protein n=1 Tax=Cladophialophora carrionii CBS 160.54 TaxID=1279043 RepID=V9DP45_9EURO|nr:uncharacterized protein G647_01125 [Cladophialophora carrionii CBS 160.54]ETI28674.1 hypothetical protein G647_01125 [Cladophialophora carrionii CBS 160.54]